MDLNKASEVYAFYQKELELLEKAKYISRWKGPDGKWRYKYPDKNSEKSKKVLENSDSKVTNKKDNGEKKMEVKVEKSDKNYGTIKTDITPVEGSKILKKELQNNFPGVKFSVKTNTYFVGHRFTVAEVRWKGDLPKEDVRKITEKYRTLLREDEGRGYKMVTITIGDKTFNSPFSLVELWGNYGKYWGTVDEESK